MTDSAKKETEEKYKQKGLTNPITFLDIFGYHVRLDVDADNKTHKTTVGAIGSLIYLAIFIWCAI